VCTSLERQGVCVLAAGDMRHGLVEATSQRPNMVVVDLGVTGIDETDPIRDLRDWSNAPILALSGRSQDKDKIEAFDAGADDYLVKPFSVAELLVRIRAHLRKFIASASVHPPVLEFENVKVDLSRRSLERSGERVHLTPTEYRLLTHLAARPHSVLTHRQLLRAIWGPNHDEDTQYLRVYVAQVRKKIEQDSARPRHLLTEPGIGYRFVP